VKFDAETSLRLIAESLSLVDRLGAEPINARNVRMADRTLVLEIVVPSADPIGVRGEIAGVMGALSGLDVRGLFPMLEVQSFGVLAFDPSGQDLLSIVSSIEAAGFAANGQPIEWLARSWVQENTPAYRRSQADRLIGQIETPLREALDDHHASEHAGEEYLDNVWTSSVVAEMRNQARASRSRSSSPSRWLTASPGSDRRHTGDQTHLIRGVTAYATQRGVGCAWSHSRTAEAFRSGSAIG
jgi:hypothetical protein